MFWHLITVICNQNESRVVQELFRVFGIDKFAILYHNCYINRIYIRKQIRVFRVLNEGFIKILVS